MKIKINVNYSDITSWLAAKGYSTPLASVVLSFKGVKDLNGKEHQVVVYVPELDEAYVVTTLEGVESMIAGYANACLFYVETNKLFTVIPTRHYDPLRTQSDETSNTALVVSLLTAAIVVMAGVFGTLDFIVDFIQQI